MTKLSCWKLTLVAAVLSVCAVSPLNAQSKPQGDKSIKPMMFVATIPADGAPLAPNTVNPLCPGSTNAPHCWIGTWVAPTLHTDNTPITTPLVYDVQRAEVVNGVVGTPITITTVPTSALTIEDDTVVATHTYVFTVTAHETINGVTATSNPSNQVTAVVSTAPPNPPVLTGVSH